MSTVTHTGTRSSTGADGGTRPGRTALVTGIGVAAPNGLGTEAYWRATLEGRSGIGPITRFDSAGYPVRLAGEVPDFEAAAHIPSRLLPQTDRTTQLSLYAADASLRDSGADLEGLPDYGAGVTSASTMGGFEFGQRELQNLWAKGGRFVSAYQSFAWFYAVNTGQISIRHGLRGACSALVTDQSGGLDAMGNARRQIRKGTSLMVAGGVDGALCPLGMVGFLSSAAMSTSSEPDRAYLPFAREARGQVPGEGGAFLVLEDAEAAQRRDARSYGEVAGYAATFDVRTPGTTDADPDGTSPNGRAGSGLERAIRRALDDARLAPRDVGVVFADGAGVPELDRAEAQALAAVFGPRGVPVTAPKSGTGRLYAGGASLDLATALLSLRDGVIPHTVNVAAPSPEHHVDLVCGAPREVPLTSALVLARGRGGFNAAVALRRTP